MAIGLLFLAVIFAGVAAQSETTPPRVAFGILAAVCLAVAVWLATRKPTGKGGAGAFS